MNEVREEHAASQVSHDERRHQLDLRLLEIDDLKRALSTQARELLRTETDRARLAEENGDVARSVATLEADLQRVRNDAEVFGRDLRLLRAQKDRLEEERHMEQVRAERAQKQAQAQIRVLKEELDVQKEKAREAAERLGGHVCAACVPFCFGASSSAAGADLFFFCAGTSSRLRTCGCSIARSARAWSSRYAT